MRKLSRKQRLNWAKAFHYQHDYLPNTTNFDGFTKKAPPADDPDLRFLCPVCKGYGGWNLRLDAYGPGQHFQAHCSQCNGWGWVSECDRDCVHDSKELSQAECRDRKIEHWGMCYHVYVCTKCGRIRAYDSSD